jgi:hypothetical protein
MGLVYQDATTTVIQCEAGLEKLCVAWNNAPPLMLSLWCGVANVSTVVQIHGASMLTNTPHFSVAVEKGEINESN